MSRIDDSLHVVGTLSAGAMAVPANAINNDALQAGVYFDAEKFEQQQVVTTWITDHTTDAVAKRVVATVIYGSVGEVVDFKAGATVAATSTGAAIIDLKKNGTTILTGTITIDSGNAAFSQEAAPGFTSTTLVAGDVLEVSINSVSGSTVPKGVFTQLVIRQRPV